MHLFKADYKYILITHLAEIILTESYCSYFFSEFQVHLFLFCSCDNWQLAKRGNGLKMRNPYIRCESTKFLITTINLKNTTFPSVTDYQNTLKPKILMVLSLFCCKILCIYLCLSISVSKRCHNVINIYF